MSARFEMDATSALAYAMPISNTRSGWKGYGNKLSNSMRIIRHLPDAPEPTRAAYKKPVEYINSKHLRVVEVPTVYNPRPAPPKKVKRFVGKKPAPRKERIASEVRGFWTESRVKKLIEMYDAGMTYDEIGDYFGKTKSTIRGKIRRLTDGGMVSNRRNDTPWTAKDLDTMKKMRNAGKTFDEIANKLGRSPQGCYEYYRKKVGLKCKT